jgi:subtilase family serine protease
MFGRCTKRKNERAAILANAGIELLEPRRMLSAAADITLHSDAIFRPAAASSSVQGYTPAQIRTAYGFDQVSLGSSGVSADGRGQTIAIVDAYNDPNIASDLSAFDSQFGVSALTSLKVVNQTGGTHLPTTDSGWAGEIALDVEWAHAIAPGANILLVEANSSQLSDLMAAVDYARNAAGVSVVSMSWGGSEFFSWGGGEFSSQTDYDPFFTTPSGHQGVTFIAAAGDSGASGGVQWPASSPNVISVGGTSLFTADSTGTYSSEASWTGTSGGFSQVETEPTYQQGAQSSGVRTTPDVSYNGDPNTGFAVYDSVPDQGFSGWEVVGGTSAGAPQWAALVAIADQGRAAAGSNTLDGATQTLPVLYGLYSAPGTSGYSSYTADFYDVQTSGGGRFHWRFGGFGFNDNPATAGYDTATGLGSPKAGPIVDALINASSSGTSGTSGGTGSGSGGSNGTTPAQLPAGQLSGTFVNAPRVNVIGGDPGSLRLRITNTGTTRFTGPVSITLYASTDQTLTSDDTQITTVTLTKVNLRAGGSRTVNVKFDYPTTLSDGSYYLIASIDETGTNTAPADAVTETPANVAAANVDLSTTFNSTQPITVNPGHNDTAVITIQNVGNVTASGTVDLSLYASTDGAIDSSSELLTSIPTHTIHVRPGKSITLRVTFVAPTDLSTGTYQLIASTTSNTNPADTNASNDVAVADTQ